VSPVSIPVPDKSTGDTLTETNWDSHLRDNINKLLDRGHRVLTVAQFAALTGLEDGDEVYVEVDATNGVHWHVRYVASQPAGRKWVFLGGPPLVSEVDTSEATSSSTYAALTTAGPAVALPRAGDYDIVHGSAVLTPTGNHTGVHSYDIGGTAAVDNDNTGFGVQGSSPSGRADVSRKNRKTGLTAVTLTSKYRSVASGSVSFANRYMSVTPVRIDHAA
jgi:hypothetical protein